MQTSICESRTLPTFAAPGYLWANVRPQDAIEELRKAAKCIARSIDFTPNNVQYLQVATALRGVDEAAKAANEAKRRVTSSFFLLLLPALTTVAMSISESLKARSLSVFDQLFKNAPLIRPFLNKGDGSVIKAIGKEVRFTILCSDFKFTLYRWTRPCPQCARPT
jgi:hypothetical protein